MTFSFVHVSDLHLSPVPRLPFWRILGKQATGYLSWNRKRKHVHENAVIERALEKIHTLKPDQICITGDVINIGQPEEFANSMEWLPRFGGGDTVSLIPGNHDAYIPQTAHMVEENWAEWMTGDNGEARFPYVKKRGPVAIIGLRSGVPTLPFLATGRVSEAQLMSLADILDETGKEGLFRVVMIHHPPQENAAKRRISLSNDKAVRRLLAHHGCELVLHGHLHRQLVAEIQTPAAPIKVMGCGALSMNGRRLDDGRTAPAAHFHYFKVSRGKEGWNLEVEDYTYRPEDSAFICSGTRNYLVP